MLVKRLNPYKFKPGGLSKEAKHKIVNFGINIPAVFLKVFREVLKRDLVLLLIFFLLEILRNNLDNEKNVFCYFTKILIWCSLKITLTYHAYTCTGCDL